MPAPKKDERPAHIAAAIWVQQIFTISVEMALPAGIGYWLDQKWGTEPWLVIGGAILGFVIGMKHLLQLAARANQKRPPIKRDPRQ